MSSADASEVEFDDLPSEDEIDVRDQAAFSDAVLHATDWTTETIVNQLDRGNIFLNPSFQRRDAWRIPQKSRFIESLILGLPIPQIVLAESQDHRGRFLVLDGKQRLLSLQQFWGLGTGVNNAYALAGLEVRKDLRRKRLSDLRSQVEFESDLNALLNQPIRTVVIKNWPSVDFLHIVFLRLNTGSVKLSPQELRQALFPGPFSDWIDHAASASPGLRALLRLREPDYRMRDIEVLARYIAFRLFITDYTGRMKEFLDSSFKRLNKEWSDRRGTLETAVDDLESAITTLRDIFGEDLARKPGARPFNRAIFDALVFYAHVGRIQRAMRDHAPAVREAYVSLFDDANFRAAVERDTAGVPNTVLRLARWGAALGDATRTPIPTPRAADVPGGGQAIRFTGF